MSKHGGKKEKKHHKKGINKVLPKIVTGEEIISGMKSKSLVPRTIRQGSQIGMNKHRWRRKKSEFEKW